MCVASHRVRRVALRVALAILFVVMRLSTSSAQTASDPRTLLFAPSSDHFATDLNGLPLVNHYDLSVYQKGSQTPFSVVSVGKPPPGPDGTIQVDLVSVLPGWPLPSGVTYDARVSAVGPTESVSSAISNDFIFSGSCTYSLSPNSASFAASGGQATLEVTSGPSCTWSVNGAPSWVTFNASGGIGSQTLGFSVAANGSTSSRMATFTVAGTLVTISQAGVACAVGVTPGTTAFGASGGSSSAAVTAPTGCSWSASSAAPWITLNGSSYSGAQTVGYVVAANTTTAPRTGGLTIAGVSMTITQDVASCTATLSKLSDSFDWKGTTGSVGLTTGSACAWTAVSSAPWLTVTPQSGVGKSTISYSLAKNMSSLTRVATIVVGNQSLVVTQTRH